MTVSIKQLEEELLGREEIDETMVERLRKDERKGVQKLLKRYDSMKQKTIELENMHKEMSQYEKALHKEGYVHIAGLDEVGRGPLAGPVVAAAVILPHDFKLLGLTDSKKLSKEKREAFYDVIVEQAICYSVAMVHAAEIDELNIYESTKVAMSNAVKGLTYMPDHLLLDAMKLDLTISQTSLIKGDQKSITIAASSVLAKVTRDRYMEEVDRQFPHYGFKSHVGYGTREHLGAISKLGITKEHRKSFKPIGELISS